MRYALFLLLACSTPSMAADPLSFWDHPRRGANCFNEAPPDAAYFRALRSHGATWVRLTFSKWRGQKRDFLFGSLDEYRSLVPGDLAVLRDVLDAAQEAGIEVVLTPLELPGARWRQLNGGKFDDRLWSDRRYWEQSAKFWRDLAEALQGHPAIAAYNLLNEPVPERRGGLAEHAGPDAQRDWYAKHRGGTRDLPAFYTRLIAAIRSVDELTPVMLDAGHYAAADGFTYWPGPLADARVLYAYHMYEPWAATSAPNLKRESPYRYPGQAPFGDAAGHWDASRVETYLQLPLDWGRRHGIPPGRMVAAEFGCMRRWADCPRYLEDMLSALEADGVHWAFYSFREDWDGMDYELGREPLPWRYWEALERGETFEHERGPNPVFEPILKRLQGRE